MKLSPTMLRVLRDVDNRSKGWPIGIPAPKKTAYALVARGLVEWAPPQYVYPRPVFSVRLTWAGKYALTEGSK
jgi:hypothetical protein